jgi:glycosyltransferase involved in cell wall biosynthesis
MAYSATIQADSHASNARSPIASGGGRLRGKRVAMVMFSYYPDDPRPRRAIDAFVKEGMHVDLVCLRDGNSPWHEALRGIDVLRIPLKRRRGGKLAYVYQYTAFILFSSLVLALRSLTRGYDLVYVHNMPDILVVSALIPKALGAKVILDLHDPMPELMMTIFKLDKNSRGVRWMSRLEKWSIARTDSVVTVSQAFKRVFAARSCSSEKIEVVMNTPDSQIFPFRPPATNAAENQVRNKAFVIMYHGSLLERNGLDLAVEALARVQVALPTVELRIYGARTPFLERVLDMAQSKGLHQAVHYLGPKLLEDLVPEIEKCDVGVIPNHKNSFTEINTPTRIFEYLALGKPAIAPRTTGIQDYFSDGSLVFFEPGNPDDLATKIEYVLSHPAEANSTVRRGQEVYQEHVWDKERQRLIRLVAGLLGNGVPQADSKSDALTGNIREG